MHILTSDHVYTYFPKHYHETYSMAMLYDGAKDFKLNNAQHILDNSNMATMNPCDIHYGNSVTDDGWKQLVIFFDEHAIKSFTEENQIKNKHFNFETMVSNDFQYRQDILTFCKSAINAESNLEVDHAYEQIIGRILAKEKHLSAEHKLNNCAGVKRSISLMHEVPDAKHRLNDLAKTANMSKFHYLRSFKDETGMTPHAYLNALRVERARKLLFSSPENLSDIAFDCGFADQAHLTRAYKKIYGMTPGSIIRK